MNIDNLINFFNEKTVDEKKARDELLMLLINTYWDYMKVDNKVGLQNLINDINNSCFPDGLKILLVKMLKEIDNNAIQEFGFFRS